MTTAYLNGEFLPLTEAKIPAMDRGYLFGDGVYEVIPVYNNHPFRLEQHLRRLHNSLTAIKLVVELQDKDWETIFTQLIEQNGGGNQTIYVQCTRGPAPMRDHTFPAEIHPTIFAYSIPLQTKSITELSRGIAAITLPDIRWHRADIKAITLLANVLLKQQAAEAGAFEAILIHDSYALEGSASNLFIVKNGVIITPPLSPRILGGVTRDLVLELATQYHDACEQKNILVSELQTANEIWLTSSSREIMPVIKLNDNPVGNGQAGPVWYKMIEHYQNFKANFAKD